MSINAASQRASLQTISLGDHFEITPKGLVVRGRPSFDAFDALGETLRTLEHSLAFVIGDFFREVENRFGEQASQILDHTGWSESTLRVYRWTATKVSPEDRNEALTFSHHQVVAALPPREQRQWLSQAADGDGGTPWPVARLKAAVKANGDQPVTAWICVALCESERQRDALARELEGRGIRCKASEKRGGA